MKKPMKLAANNKQVGGNHYKVMGVQPWEVVDTWPIDMRIGAYRAGALKYLMRMGTKDESAQEIGKGIHYLEKLKEVLESDEYRAGIDSGLGEVATSQKRSTRRTKVRHDKSTTRTSTRKPK